MDSSAIAVIGNANLDIVGGPINHWPERGTEIFLDRSDMRIGGSAANTALVLARLGAQSGLISAAGSDLSGDMIIQQFSRPLDRIARIDGPSSVTFGVLHLQSERTFFSTRGHLDHFEIEHVRGALGHWPLTGALVMVSGSFAMPAFIDRTASLLEFLNEQGATIAIDPGWPGDGWSETNIALVRQWISLASHVLVNDKELLGFTNATCIDAAMKEIAAYLRDSACLVVKCGAAGARFIDTSGLHGTVPAPIASVFDTIGAGDAFNAGYLAAIAEGYNLEAASGSGCRIATEVVSQFPRREEPLTLKNEEKPS